MVSIEGGDQLVHSPHRISAVQGSTTLMVGSTQILADGVERIRPDCEHSMELIINLNLDFERENVNVFTSADLESSDRKYWNSFLLEFQGINICLILEYFMLPLTTIRVVVFFSTSFIKET